MLERLKHQELVDQLAVTDVLVLPSLVEGFGLVLGEALAKGVHLIATENTGLPDLHLPEFAATAAVAGDLESLGGAILRAHRMHQLGELDRVAIASLALDRSWRNFRREVVIALADSD